LPPAALLAESMTAPVIFLAVLPVEFVIFFVAPTLVALPWAFAELIVLNATVTKAANNTVAAIMNDICFCITLYDGGTEFNGSLYIFPLALDQL
jgi:hypothetical protein